MYLNCHSFYSLRYGTLSIEDLVKQALENKVTALALTDINAMTGVYDFVASCNKHGIKPLVGIEYRTKGKLNFIGIAKNRKGFQELNEFLSIHNLQKKALPDVAPSFNNVYCIYLASFQSQRLRENEFIGITIDDVNKLPLSKWRWKQEKLVILHPVTFSGQDQFRLHKVLRCVDQNILFSKLSEENHSRAWETMLPIDTLLSYYKNYPQIISNTEKLLDECDFQFDFKTPKNKKYYTFRS